MLRIIIIFNTAPLKSTKSISIKMKILFYKSLGITSLLIGIVGAFLPLLPTTCFILLSAWCFSKSSPEWHAKLRRNAFFGKTLTQLEQQRSIPKNARKIAIGSILISVAYTFLMVDSIGIKLMLLLFATIAIYSINQFKEQR